MLDSKLWLFLEAKVRGYGSWPLTERHVRLIKKMLRGADTFTGHGDGI